MIAVIYTNCSIYISMIIVTILLLHMYGRYSNLNQNYVDKRQLNILGEKYMTFEYYTILLLIANVNAHCCIDT